LLAQADAEARYNLVNRDSAKTVRVHPLRARLKEVVATTILDAAEQVFSERGLDARLEDIATQAGVAVGTLYNYFADRQALVEAMLETHRAHLLERLEAVVIRNRELPFRAQLEAILAEIVAVSLPKLRLRLLLLQATSHRLIRHIETRQQCIAIIGPVLEQARQNGELSPDPIGLQAQLLFGLTHAVLSATEETSRQLSPDVLPNIVVSAFLDGVGGVGCSR